MPSKFGGVSVSKFGGVPVQPEGGAAVQPRNEGFLGDLDAILSSVPGVPALAELGAGMARGTAGIVDFFGPEAINEILTLGGSDKRIPTVRQGMQRIGLAPERGAFTGPGMTADLMGAAGEVIPASVGVSSLLRSAATNMPKTSLQSGLLGQPAESAANKIREIIRMMGRTPGSQPAQQGGTLLNVMNNPTTGMVAQDVGLAVASSTGAELGQQIGGQPGAIIGGLAGMLGATGASMGLRGLLSAPQGALQLRQTLTGLSNEGAAKLLAEQMTREGMSPEDVARLLDNLGPEAMPADVGMQFRMLLRAASDEIPAVQGQLNNSVYARQAGQAGRLATALDSVAGVPGLNLSDEMERLAKVSGPVIDDLYAKARSSGYQIPEEVPRMFGMKRTPNGWEPLPRNETVSRELQTVWDDANEALSIQRASGKTPGNLEFIDELKRTIDDRIGASLRNGEKSRASNFLGLKRRLVADVDDLIPEYAAARKEFAQKAELENAGELGTLYFKMSPRELVEYTEDMSQAELRMFRAGAKQSILDRAETLQTTADARRALFGRNRDVKKLGFLFDTPENFNAFQQALQREVEFTITKNAVTGGSRTNLSAQGTRQAREMLTAATDAASGPLGVTRLVTNVIDNLSNAKSQEARLTALREAGEFLLTKGLDPQQVAAVLRQGNVENVKRALMEVSTGRYAGPAARGFIAERTSRERN